MEYYSNLSVAGSGNKNLFRSIDRLLKSLKRLNYFTALINLHLTVKWIPSLIHQSSTYRKFLTAISKSCSLVPFPAALLKEHLDLLLPTLCRVLNLSLASGQLTSSPKTAVLSPLLKKPSLDHEDLGNYGPI